MAEKYGGWRRKKNRALYVYFIEVVTVLFLAAIFTFGFCKQIHIEEDSMSPRLIAGDTALVDRLTGKIFGIREGNLIAFRLSERENAAVHVKRVAAVPGDTVEIRDGSVYVNGKLYGEEGMIDMNAEGLVREMITLEKGEYFVLGDNSGESEDSRSQDIGSIEKKMIIGKVWFVVSPLKSFGFKS